MVKQKTGIAKALSIYPVEPVTKAAARVTKFPSHAQ
jgi:hypothetical protein